MLLGNYLPLVSASILNYTQQIRTTVKVRQRIRFRGRLLQAKQTHYSPKPPGYVPIPMSVLGSGYIRRLIRAGTQASHELIQKVSWADFSSTVRGVRWHPSGAWRVSFKKEDLYRNFFVDCNCYFKVEQYGFHRAKQLAIGYRRRLEVEWTQLQRAWKTI
jgi:hypothetical protein